MAIEIVDFAMKHGEFGYVSQRVSPGNIWKWDDVHWLPRDELSRLLRQLYKLHCLETGKVAITLMAAWLFQIHT